MSNTIRIDFDISAIDTLKEKLSSRRNKAQEVLDLAVDTMIGNKHLTSY